jgi:hypothetical protein
MSLRSLLVLLLVALGCGREVAPPARPAPSPKAERPAAGPAQRTTQLAHAFPADVVLFTETVPGAPGLPMAEAALRVLLGDVPETQAILDATELMASGMVDLTTMSGATVLKLRDDAPLRAWARALSLSSEKGDVERFTVSPPFGLAWWGERRLLVLGVSEMVELTISTLRRERTSLAEARRGELPTSDDAGTVMYVALPQVQARFVEPLLATIGGAPSGGTFIRARSASEPFLSGMALEPLAVDLAEVLPEETILYLAAGAPRGSLADLPAELAPLVEQTEAAAVALLVRDDFRLGADDPLEGGAAVLVLRLREGASLGEPARRFLEEQLAAAPATIEHRGRHLLVAVGSRALAKRAAEALDGKKTLAAAGRHEAAALEGAQLRAWADARGIAGALAKMIDPNALKLFGGDGGMKATSMAVRAEFGADRWSYELAGTEILSAAMVLGVGAAVVEQAIHKYLAAARAAGAKPSP